MILSTSERRNLPYQRLASTDDGEVAYYIPFADGNGSETAMSRTGDEWVPEYLANGRVSVFIAGVPGAGKSYLAKEIINSLPPGADVLLFTALGEDDGNFDDLDHPLYKIKMTPENLSRMSLSAIRERSEHPVLLFDDVDKIRDKKVEQALFKLMNDALANGRGHTAHNGEGDIHVVCTSHALNDYIKTKYTFENSDYVALFPGSTAKLQYDRMMSKLGVPKELAEVSYREGKRGCFRSVIVKKTAPMYIIFGDTISLF